ncbi:MAG: hypothetical protein U1F77_17300 [Kiritimatiellia bacterium]
MNLRVLILLAISAVLETSCGDDNNEAAYRPDLKTISRTQQAGTPDAASSTPGPDSASGSSGNSAPPKISASGPAILLSDGTHVTAVSATIEQSGGSVVIRTSKGAPGRMLTGRIGSNGRMKLTDADDGEIWSTFYGAATSDHVKVADYLYPTPAGHTGTVLQVIDLRH